MTEPSALPSPPPPMLWYLTDPANAITALGLALSFLGIYLAATGRLELGVAVVLWAFLVDHIDGVVARRTPRRRRDAYLVGRHLDSLTDLASDCIFPAFVLVTVNSYTVLSLTVATVLVIVGAVRLSFYNTFGAPGGCYVGVPVTYTVPVVAALFACRQIIGASSFGYVLEAALAVLITLHLTRIRVPVIAGWGYAAVSIYTIGISTMLLASRIS
jgi:CDP-diacylglycerol---serine O-phosphatidyltransferase